MKQTMSKQSMRAILTLGMIQAACPEMLRLDMDALSRHMCIFGGTGTGKTKFSVLMLRQLLTYGVGATVVTPHPDAAGIPSIRGGMGVLTVPIRL